MADNGIILNWMLGLINRKVVVPTEYHDQCSSVRTMLQDDMTGLIDVLTDFAVSSAAVDFSIETEYENLNEIFTNWSKDLNASYVTLPIGLKALAQEYFKERWKGSSFPVLKITEWDKYASNIVLPNKMVFVDGASVYADDTDTSDILKIEGYDYYLGSKFEPTYKITSDNYIMTKPYERWFEKYPTPYLIKRGVYHNYKIIEALKSKQLEILDQIIPYLLMVKKGTENLAINQSKTYSQPELQEVVKQFQELKNDIHSLTSEHNASIPIRASNFDEDLKHLIPNIESMFKSELFAQAERNILSGLGFVDVIQGVSSTRREATLNPKAFVQEVTAGIDGFKDVLRRLLWMIKKKNGTHVKYMDSDFYISSSPVKTFMTPEFETAIRGLYDRGGVSKRTYTELISGLDYSTEVFRREHETKAGLDETMYPPITQNFEEKGIDLPGDNPEDTNKDDVPDDKKGLEAKNFKNASFSEEEEYIYDSSLEIADETIESSEDEIDLVRSFAPRLTEKYIRLRQQSPAKFDKKTFKTVTISPSKGIKAIVAKKPNQKLLEVQSYLFIKKKWSVSGAKKWENDNKEQYSTIMAKLDLVSAPYTQTSELPVKVQKYPIEKQRAWLKLFNNSYKYMYAKTGNAKVSETYSFRVAYSRIKEVKLNKSFIDKIKGHLFPNSSQDYEIENNLELASVQEEAKELLQRTVKEKQNKILDKLLKEEND